MYFGRKIARSSNNSQSVQKQAPPLQYKNPRGQTTLQEQEQRNQMNQQLQVQYVPQINFFKHKNQGALSLNQVAHGLQAGMNTRTYTYFFSTQGNGGANGNLFQINLSPLPGEQKTYLTVQSLSCLLLGYTQATFPNIMFLQCQGAIGSTQLDGTGTSNIAAMVPKDSPSVLKDTGSGLVGYNVAYCMIGQPQAYDISSMPILRFHVALNNTQSRPPTYPISQVIKGKIQITRVIY